MKIMETANLLKSIEKFKQYGDAIRIARIVNAKRIERGEKKFSPAYIGYMLNGERTMLPEVAKVATKYFKAQKELTENILA